MGIQPGNKNLTNSKVILAQDLIALPSQFNVNSEPSWKRPVDRRRLQLHRQVSGIHLCVRGQVIEGVVINSLAVFDARASLL